MGDNPAFGCPAEFSQGAACIYEIIKGVGLLLQLAVQIPLITFGHTAANMGNRINHTAINQ